VRYESGIILAVGETFDDYLAEDNARLRYQLRELKLERLALARKISVDEYALSREWLRNERPFGFFKRLKWWFQLWRSL
jgi:hypothetical protein